MSEHHGVTRDELISAAFAILEQAKIGVPLMDDHGQPILCDGEPIMARDHASANQSLEIIGRLAGFWIERREVITRPRAMADWSDAQLQAEQDQIQAEIEKRKAGAVVELRAVGGKDGEISVAG